MTDVNMIIISVSLGYMGGVVFSAIICAFVVRYFDKKFGGE